MVYLYKLMLQVSKEIKTTQVHTGHHSLPTIHQTWATACTVHSTAENTRNSFLLQLTV